MSDLFDKGDLDSWIDEEQKSTHHNVKPTPKCPFKNRPCDKQCKAYYPGTCQVLQWLEGIYMTVR